ncbi:PH domain-containing protein [Xylocopilactobacillus apicola]|uniref:SHOCT domain-containing protein n=1 Tax=Xylocopilactobacillus apicola TaxID=2932184 RepID=A0AAU9DD95_9LACO|nr:PH domain-containing protein [Xylocopilactobacillus apicola]BDR57780.1 hypothetical protein XA3_02210 [Xylocopilactobacillus apicola]
MSKLCAIDNAEIGMMSGKVQVDGMWVCEDHLKQAGFKNATEALKKIDRFSLEDLQQALARNVNLKEAIDGDKSSRMAEIKAQFEAAKVVDLVGTKKEVKALPEILQPNEVVKYATSGVIKGTVLMVLTDSRILFIDKGLVYGFKSTEIPLNMVNSVSYSTGMLFGKISITNGAITTTIESVGKESAPIMVDRIKTEIANSHQAAIHHDDDQDLISKLRELKSLVDEGILTEEEFTAKKKQLLNLK